MNSMKKKEKKLNDGEREEYLIKIKLCNLRDNNKEIKNLGKIKSVGFEKEYKTIDWSTIDFDRLKDNQNEIKKIAKILDITKGSSKDKADVKINNIYYSLKCIGYGKPTLVNHTSRVGWLEIAKIKKLNIEFLDSLVNEYWQLRENGDISEDCSNSHDKSPFRNNKEIIKPYLDFFIFEGSGQGKSKYPASNVLEFESFENISAWKIFGKEYLDTHWDKLYFCMRYKKGIMPLNKSDFDKHKSKKMIEPWIRHFKGKKGDKKYRGALHVRVG